MSNGEHNKSSLPSNMIVQVCEQDRNGVWSPEARHTLGIGINDDWTLFLSVGGERVPLVHGGAVTVHRFPRIIIQFADTGRKLAIECPDKLDFDIVADLLTRYWHQSPDTLERRLAQRIRVLKSSKEFEVFCQRVKQSL